MTHKECQLHLTYCREDLFFFLQFLCLFFFFQKTLLFLFFFHILDRREENETFLRKRELFLRFPSFFFVLRRNKERNIDKKSTRNMLVTYSNGDCWTSKLVETLVNKAFQQVKLITVLPVQSSQSMIRCTKMNWNGGSAIFDLQS